MCLYPKLIQNRKYKANKKNGGIIPPVPDNRVLWTSSHILMKPCTSSRPAVSNGSVTTNEQTKGEIRLS